MPDIRSILGFMGRHLTIILLALVIVALGGVSHERVETFKAAALAEAVSLFLSHVALFVFTSDNFKSGEQRYAKVLVFMAVHLLVGMVYAGSYFVEWKPDAAAITF
ncbi:MAG: hypothetical protein FGM24_04380 [Candidatus Kapabacteria bacterium]|nr:hypothetical protein [Candidatus Kapabacteria bacterium]